MKKYKRNPLLKVVTIAFLIAHVALGGRMFSTENYIVGSITLALGLFWVYILANEFTPYLEMDGYKLKLYKNVFTMPLEYKLNKDVQMYYHSNERLVFTYKGQHGLKEKAKIFLGYLTPHDSKAFIQDFRAILAEYQEEAEEAKEEMKNQKEAKKSKEKKQIMKAEDTKITKTNKKTTDKTTNKTKSRKKTKAVDPETTAL